MTEAWVPPPKYGDYAQFLSDMIGGMPDRARQAQAQESALQQQQFNLSEDQRKAVQQQALQKSMANLPMVGNQLNYAEAMNRLAQGGNYADAINLAPSALQQQQTIDAQKAGSALDGAPPSSAAANVSTRAPGASQAAPQGGAGSRSVDDLVYSTLGSGNQSKTVAANIARVLKVDLNSPLTTEQMQQAQKYAASYVQRKGIAQNGPLPTFAAGGAGTGASPNYDRKVVQTESHGDPLAGVGTKHVGLVQASREWWDQFGGGGDILNPKDQIAALDRESAFNRPRLAKAIGRDPTDADLYLAHQQGLTGAEKLLQNPNAKASDIVGMRAVIQNGGRPNMTAAEFAQMWSGKFDKSGGGKSNFALSGGVPGGPGVAIPQSPTGGATLAGSFPQIVPQAPMQQPQPLAGAPMPAPGAGSAPAPVAPPMPPQQPAAPMQQQAQAPQQQPRPLIPLPPLLPGFSTPQATVQELDRRIRALGTNPKAKVLIDQMQERRDAIIKATSPMEVRPGLLVDPQSGQIVYQAPLAPSANPKAAAFQHFMEVHPDATPEQQESFIRQEGGGARPRNAEGMILQAYTDANPGATPEQLESKAMHVRMGLNAAADFGSKKSANTIQSFNTLAGHLDTLKEAAVALQNGDNQTLNRIKNVMTKWDGSPNPTNFDAVNSIVADEIVKAVTGASGALGDREDAKKKLSEASSPEQLFGVMDYYKELVAQNMSSLRTRFTATTGLPPSEFDKMLTPEALETFSKKDKNGSDAPAKVSTKPEYDALPSGTKYVAPDGSVRTKQ